MSRPCAVCGCFGTCHPNCPSGDVVHEPDPLTILDCAVQASQWSQQYSEQPYAVDESTVLKAAIKELAEENGFTYDQVMDEMNHIEYMAYQADEGPYGRNV